MGKGRGARSFEHIREWPAGYDRADMPHRRDRRAYPLDPALDFLRLLWAIEHRLQRMSKRMEASLGVTGPPRLVLRIVGRSPGLSAGGLAHLLLLPHSSIPRTLQRFVSKCLL